MVVAFDSRRDNVFLPVYLTRFIGRETELDLLARLFDNPDERVITLVGPGGVGKTRLLVEAARRSLPGESIYVDGVALERAEFVLPALVDLLGIDRSIDRPNSELLSEYLSGRQLIILLDNMEHLLDAAVDISALLHALPGLRVVATSRAPLHISGERLVNVAPLTTNTAGPDSESLSVAAQFFLDRAVLTGRFDRPTETDLATIEAICVRLDGLPLAIELAAARLRVLSPSALLALLTHQLEVLTGGPRDISERHRTLRATIGWSYDLLDDETQRLLRELSIFTESFVLEGVNAVCTPAKRATVDMLESLVDQALLMRIADDPGDRPHYRMLISIREFALESLRQTGDEERLGGRHAAWFLQLAETLEPALLGGTGQQTAIEWLERATPNLRQALAFMVQTGDQESALRMATALSRYWLIQVRGEEAKTAFETIFAMGEPRPTHVWAAALRCAATEAEFRFENRIALDRIERAIAIWQELDDTASLARARTDLGNIYNNLGRFDDAIAEFERAAQLADSTANRRTYLVAAASIATAYLRKGSLLAADQAFAEVIPQLRTLDDRWMLATALSNAAVLQQRLGDRPAGRLLLEESLQLQRELGDDHGIASTLINLADVLDDPVNAERDLRQALELAQRISAPSLEAAAQVGLGGLAWRRGDRQAATRLYVEALNGFAALDEELEQSDVIALLAELGVESDPAAAVRLIGATQAIYEQHAHQPTGSIAEHVAEVDRRLRKQLGADRFERELALGRASTLAAARVDALTLARQSPLHPLPANSDKRLASGLTPRELDVLRLVAQGKTDRDIAEALFITPKTSNHHVTRILAKLECRNRSAATAFAFQQGLI